MEKIQIIYKTKSLISIRKALKKKDIGFVPTMGNLHAGHLSLVESALRDHNHVFVSIFVNSKQFGEGEDFESYPRTLEEDVGKLSNLIESKFAESSKEIYVYAPSDQQEIYPEGYQTMISVPKISDDLEGRTRPTHFEGVATVVYNLFRLILPENAYFGLKDYQQCIVIKQMVRDLRLPLKINLKPIVRDDDGMALSSRNQYLSANERNEGRILSKVMMNIKEIVREHKNDSRKEKLNFITNYIKEILSKYFNFEYLEVRDSLSLKSPNDKTKNIVILGVYKVGMVRLLDNIVVKLG